MKTNYTIEKTQHDKLVAWVEEMAELCQPEEVYWCDGSKEENDTLSKLLVEKARLLNLMRLKSQTVTLLVQILQMSHALNHAPLFALSAKSMQALQIIGVIQKK